jgi:hypothetical protein
MKVETHNHPTAISPFPGASTGAGGEIRDEGATGRGSKPKAGLTGLLGLAPVGQPERPAGAHRQPAADHDRGPAGRRRVQQRVRPAQPGRLLPRYEQTVDGVVRGYHKPIMIAGGLGTIDAELTSKIQFPAGTLLVQLGGPGMRIGMGGGAASSMATGANAAELDFDSVQRGNPEIERRAQEVINHCWSLGAANPVLAIHDVGAGGLSNAFPELTNDAGRGARFDLRKIPLEESGLAPKEIWCNESQERYVLAIAPESLEQFRAFCERERCPFAVVGVATEERQLVVGEEGAKAPVDMPMEVLLGKAPKMHRDVKSVRREVPPIDLTGVDLQAAAVNVLAHPTVASKRFLVTIGDRTVGGLSHRDQMVGPVAGAGGRLRRDAGRLPRLRGRGDEHGRAHAAGRHRPGRIGPHGGRRGHHQPAGGAVRAAARQAVGQLDGGVRRARRGRRAVRDRQGRRHGAVPGAGHLHPGGQGQPVHAHAVEGRRHREEGHVAGQPGDHRLRHPGRRARHAHAAAGCHHRRHHAGAGRPGQGPAPHGRQHPGAGARPARRRGARSRRPAGPGEPGQRRQRIAGAGPPAGVPRPQRRRPVRRRLRDGVRRPRRRQPERRPAGHRRRRHQRQPRRLRRRQELGHAGRAAPGGTDAQGAVQRGTGRAAAGAHRPAQRRHAGAARARPVEVQPLRRQDPAAVVALDVGKGQVQVWRDTKAVFSASVSDLHQVWDSVSWKICQQRDNPLCADQEHAAAGDPADPGLQFAPSFDPQEDVAAPFLNLAAAPRGASCASRASTRMSRWRTASTRPASRPSTCT